jgi:F-type H+-transporting ATPase subunit b
MNAAYAEELATDIAQDVAGHAAEHGGSFPPFDGSSFPSQLFWLAVTFGLLYVLMKRVIVPRIGGILDERGNRIAGDLGEAGRLRDESETLIATYERELAEARAEAQKIAEERRAAVNADLAARRTAAEEGLGAKLAEAEGRIRAITDAALAEVDTIAASAAEAVVAQLASVSADPAEVAAAVRKAQAEG